MPDGKLTYEIAANASSFNRTVDGLLGNVSKMQAAFASLAGAAVVGGAVRRGLDFNAELNNAEVGIANVLAKFKNLSAEAAKREAARAMQEIAALEPKVSGTMQDLVQGFLATVAPSQAAGLSVQQNIDLVGRFANALANANIGAEQLAQEMGSILSANIGMDSRVAKVLQISNEDIRKAKEAGTLYQFLRDKIGQLGEAGDSAAVTFSTLSSAWDKAAAGLSRPVFDAQIGAAKELTGILDDILPLLQNAPAISPDLAQGFADQGDVQKYIVTVQAQLQELRDKAHSMGDGVIGFFRVLAAGSTGEIEAMQDLAKEYENAIANAERYVKARNEEFEIAELIKKTDADAAAQQAEAAAKFEAEKQKRQKDRLQRTGLENQLKGEKDATLEGQLSDLEKVEMAKGRIAQLDAEIAKFRGGGEEARALQLEIEREQVKRRMMELQKAINADAAAALEDEQRRADAARDEAIQRRNQADALERTRGTAAQELAILEAKATGNTEQAEAMERQLRLQQLSAQYQDQLKISAAAAADMARRQVEAEEKLRNQKPAEERRPGQVRGYSQKQKSFQDSRNPFRGLEAMAADRAIPFFQKNAPSFTRPAGPNPLQNAVGDGNRAQLIKATAEGRKQNQQAEAAASATSTDAKLVLLLDEMKKLNGTMGTLAVA